MVLIPKGKRGRHYVVDQDDPVDQLPDREPSSPGAVSGIGRTDPHGFQDGLPENIDGGSVSRTVTYLVDGGGPGSDMIHAISGGEP